MVSFARYPKEHRTMQTEELDRVLRSTLEDHQLSRSEKKALQAWLEERQPDGTQLSLIQARVFDLARSEMADPQTPHILAWVEDVVKALQAYQRAQHSTSDQQTPSEAYFSPEQDCVTVLEHLFRQSRQSCDICVFTITDNRITREIIASHQRGVRIRVITDDEKAHDLGSDIGRLRETGIEVREDRSPYHMHHKFALFDDLRLVTGSYNWTRGAAEHNEDHFIVTNDADLLRQFRKAFHELWTKWA